jgi:two-component system phosphate regulon sensor histidine kinase PhoR
MRSLVNQFLLPGILTVAVGLLGVWTGSVAIVLIAGFVAAIPSAAFAQSALRRLARLQVIASAHYSHDPTEISGTVPNDEIDEALQTVARYALTANTRFATEVERVRYLNLVLDRISDGLLIVNEDGIVAYANVAAALIFGGRNPTARSLIDVTHDHELADIVNAEMHGAAGSPEKLEFRSDGRTISASLVPLRETPKELLVVMRDITEMAHLHQLRSDFVANVSHELRTPLSTIKILTETLLEVESHGAEAQRFLEQIDSEVDSMAALVRDLLNLTRLESVNGELSMRHVAPVDLLEGVAARMQPLAERHGVTLSVSSDNAPADVLADPERMEQALVNLLANAIAHTPEGGTVSASVHGSAAGVLFVIQDTGSGIPQEDLPRIWERFFKSDRSRSGPGTGLGLAIVKHIVQAHRGTVSVESTVGHGSTFRIEIPNHPGATARVVPSTASVGQR